MKFTVILPPFDSAAEIGIVGEWRREIGEYVGQGDIFATVKSGSDGTAAEIRSPAYGILTRKFALPGEAVEVGEPLALLSGVSAGVITGEETPPAPFSAPPRYVPGGPEEVLTIGPRELALAKHAQHSWQASPHVFTVVVVEMTEVMGIAARTEVNSLACVAAAVAGALTRFPALNAQLVRHETSEEIHRKRYVHLGIVRRTPDGKLLIPVIHDAETKSVRALAREIAENDALIAAAGDDFPTEQMRGATFTLREDAGERGSLLWQTSLLHSPQAALLSLGSIQRVPVALPDDSVAVRPVLHLCLSHDARVTDEAAAGHFLADIKRELEEARFLFT